MTGFCLKFHRKRRLGRENICFRQQNNTMSKTLFFATSNKGKIKEFQHYFDLYKLDYKVETVDSDFVEPQLEDIEQIAKVKAETISKKINKPVIGEDASIEIPAHNGFPGPYTKYVHEKIGHEGLLKLLEGKDSKAIFKSAIALAVPGKKTQTFVGVIEGTLTEPKGKDGWGHDPIFIPHGKAKTWAEDYNSKMQDSHRVRALQKFVEFLKKN